MLQFYAKKSFNEEPKLVKEAPMERAWIYGSEVTDADIDRVAELYSLNKDILRDVHDKNELTRVEYSQGNLYIFVRAPHLTTRGKIVTVPFLAILKGTLLITLSTKTYVRPTELFSQVSVDMKSTKRLFLQLLSYVIRQFEMHIRGTGKYIKNTEGRLRTHDVDNRDFIKFVTVEHDLNEYNTNLTAFQSLLSRLHENRHATFLERDCEHIEDMNLHLSQLLVAIASHLSTVGSIRNAYTTISNNTLNQRMKKLTLLTLLIALPNVFFGMYGMNVVLPIADQPWAYAAIVSVSLAIVVVVALIVRKIRF